MPETITAPAGAGVGIQKFSIKPGGIGLSLIGAAPVPTPDAPPPVPDAPGSPPVFERPAPPSPFQRLYPNVDPAKVEVTLDDRGKLRLKPIETPVETPAETPAAPALPAAAAPSEPDAIAQLRAQIAEQTQIQTAMLTALMTGRPLMEVLSGAPAKAPEPDYSRFDLEDEEGRAAYAQAVRADAIAAAKAEMEATMRNHLPGIQNAQRHGEAFILQTKYGKEPDYEQKAALATQLAGNNPNISVEATYNLINQIQKSLTPAPAQPAKQPGNPILTPAQQAEKAAQAARYKGVDGGRAVGAPIMPANLKTLKQQTIWMAHQMDRGWSKEEIWAANGKG